MSTTPRPETKVYLLQNRANSFFAVGELELTDTTLRCRVTGNAGWIAKELGIPDLKERLAAGETITAFEFTRNQLKTKWLKQFMGAGFQVSAGDGKPWIVSLIDPTGFLALLEMSRPAAHVSNGGRLWGRASRSPRRRDRSTPPGRTAHDCDLQVKSRALSELTELIQQVLRWARDDADMNTHLTRTKRRGVKLVGAILAGAAVAAAALTVMFDSNDSGKANVLAGSGNAPTNTVYVQPTVGAMNMGATATFTTPSSVPQVTEAVPPVKAG